MFDLDELARWDEALDRLAHADTDTDEDQATRADASQEAPRAVEEQ